MVIGGGSLSVGLISIEAEAYWLVVVFLAVFGLLSALLGSDTCEDQLQDGNDQQERSWSPASHIHECLYSVSELLAAGGPSDTASCSWIAWQCERIAVSIDNFDQALGQRMHLAAQGPTTFRELATVLSLSGDEAVWMLVPIVLAVGHCLTNVGPDISVGLCVDFLSDILMCCVMETGLKTCVRRNRPTCAKQSTYYILPGEWWSFPSGHALRAAYLARRATAASSLLGAVPGASAVNSIAIPFLIYLWAILVAWSRVAKGRHSPLDVLAGLLCGLFVSELALHVGLETWCAAKLVAGSITCAEAVVMFMRPELRLEGFYVHLAFQSLWWVMQPFGLGLPLSSATVLAVALPNLALFSALGAASRSWQPMVGLRTPQG